MKELTLEEKASLLGGGDFWHTKAVERLGIPRFMMSDGPNGLRKQDQSQDNLGINDAIKAVCFPSACATASSFDTDLIYGMGEVIGNECQAEDLSIVLGPGVNIKRSPLCGRNFEYFSEDPYLAGKIAASYINGVQSKGVGTSIKHFAANNQEYNRMSVDTIVDERTLREIYLPAFETAVKEAQPRTVMCSYNKINGVYSSDNEWLLTEVLRNEWGFEGFVMTDWGAIDDRVQGVRAGLELEMPGDTSYTDKKIVEAVRSGELSEEEVDRSVERLLKVFYDYYDNRQEDAVFDKEKDHDFAAGVEAECAVLLENNGVLPLSTDAKVVYIGEYAAKPRFQGGGSAHINSFKVTSALETAEKKGRNVTYVKGFPADGDVSDADELTKAVEAAKAADAAVIFAGLPDSFESEGYDRKNMNMPGCQNELIAAVAAVQPNTVVVLHNGSSIEVPWADSVAAILEMYLGGQGVGAAEDALLFGEVNPSGHLAETFPMRVQDNPAYLNFPGDGKKVVYAEGIYVGYRYYDKKEIPVRWAFGHGLSYTQFEISNVRVDKTELDDDSKVTVSVDVKNAGDREGKEVVQLYVSDLNGTPDRPVKELKGFGKISLKPGETGTVSFELSARDLSYYSTEISDWFAPSGKYGLLIGDASDNIAVSTEISFTTKKRIPLRIENCTTVGELLTDERTAPIVQRLIQEAVKAFENPSGDDEEKGEGLGAGAEEMAEAMIAGLPLKSLTCFGTPGEVVEGLVAALKEAVK